MLVPRTATSGDLFTQMDRLKRDMDRMLGASASANAAGFPAMNVYASKDGIAVTAELPGVAEDDLEITVHRDTVRLEGERADDPEDAKSVHRRERSSGRFVRMLALPFQVDPEKVEANLAQGVLRLSLQRPESDKPKRISIKSQ